MLARLCVGGLVGLLAWELFAQFLTPIFVGGPLEPPALITSLIQHSGIDPVRDGRHQHVAIAHRRDEFIAAERPILKVQNHLEQFVHARFDRRQQMARYVDARFAFKAPG